MVIASQDNQMYSINTLIEYIVLKIIRLIKHRRLKQKACLIIY